MEQKDVKKIMEELERKPTIYETIYLDKLDPSIRSHKLVKEVIDKIPEKDFAIINENIKYIQVMELKPYYDPKIHVFVRATELPIRVNLTGGYMVITDVLLEFDDAIVKGSLAHELAHIKVKMGPEVKFIERVTDDVAIDWGFEEEIIELNNSLIEDIPTPIRDILESDIEIKAIKLGENVLWFDTPREWIKYIFEEKLKGSQYRCFKYYIQEEEGRNWIYELSSSEDEEEKDCYYLGNLPDYSEEGRLDKKLADEFLEFFGFKCKETKIIRLIDSLLRGDTLKDRIGRIKTFK